MDPNIFGSLVTAHDVETAARDTLRLWAPEYLAWAERASGRAPRTLPAPRSYVTSADLDKWPEEALPSVLILSPGLADKPTKDGRGSYTARWSLGLAVVVSARDADETDKLAKLYAAVLRSVLLHHPSLGGLAEAVEWDDERYDVLPGDRRRTLAAGQVALRVQVADVVAAKAGPSVPRADPYTDPPDHPRAATVEVDVHPEEVNP